VWDLATLRERASFLHARLPRTLLFSRDGRTLAVDGEDAPIDLWEVTVDHSRVGPQP
jgi:hypothetical protein